MSMKTYITFGQVHTHSINGITLDKDCVAAIEHSEDDDGHEIAMKMFDGKFCFTYPNNIREDILHYFPRGIIEIGYHSFNKKENTNASTN